MLSSFGDVKSRLVRLASQTWEALLQSIREEPIKIVCLVALTLNTTILDFLASYSLRPNSGDGSIYNVTSVILLSEAGKVLVSSLLAFQEQKTDGREQSTDTDPQRQVSAGQLNAIRGYFRVLQESIVGKGSYLMAIPAALYVLQNNLRFVALTTLDVATFQVTAQLKILTTAIFTVLLLNRILNTRHWIALTILLVGVATVQVNVREPSKELSGNSPSEESSQPLYLGFSASLVGFCANLLASLLSGLAGVYFEKILKSSTTSLWIRQLQLSTFSIVPALLVSLGSQKGNVNGFFHAFTIWTWAVIAMQVYVGLIAALVIKYTDNIMKIMASSASIILCALLQIPIFGRALTWGLAIGSGLVVGSIWLYGMAPAPTQREKPASDAEELAAYKPLGPQRWGTMTEEEVDQDLAGELLDDDELAISPEVPPPRSRQ